MNKRKHALVLFTKYPEPGVTKTRLMIENGGSLTGQEAADLYRAMLLDTTETALSAVKLLNRENGEKDTYDFFISSSPELELKRVKELLNAEFPGEFISYILDKGSCFDEHFNDCYVQLFDMEYHDVVCVGGDLPGMTPDLLVRAFGQLDRLEIPETGAMVLAPCQASGVSLVGVTRAAGMDFTGVFYNEDGISALDALVNIATVKDLPTTLLEALFDVDYMDDLGHTISVVKALKHAARFQENMGFPSRTHDMIERIGLVTTTPPNTFHDPRSRLDG